MDISKASLEDVTGAMGVGSLYVLGIFFVLDGCYGFLGFTEEYAQTVTWTIVAAIPIAFVTYLLGLISITTSEILFSLNRKHREALNVIQDIFVSTTNNFLIGEFIAYNRRQKLLKGSTPAFVVLAFGSWSEVRMMGSFGTVGYIGLLGGLLAAAVSGFCALYLTSRMQALAKKTQ